MKQCGGNGDDRQAVVQYITYCAQDTVGNDSVFILGVVSLNCGQQRVFLVASVCYIDAKS